MMCYRDRSFCNAPCKKQGGCSLSYEYVVVEKSKTTDTFIKDTLPVCTCDYSVVCGDFETLDGVDE